MSGPNVTLASNQWMIVMRIGKQGGNYDYHYWYPVFVDNMESVDDLANVRPTGQIIMAKCVSGAALQVKPIRPIAFAEQRAA